MGKEKLQCLFIGEPLALYKNLTHELNDQSLNIQNKSVVAEKAAIIKALKRQRVASLVFIADTVSFSLESLSDLVWQYSPDVIITILTEKTANISLKKPFNNTQISKLYYEKNNKEMRLHLQYLIQAVQVKWEFRRCKRLLGIAEKRCQWLVDSSIEPIAFISRDLHLYANTAYLGLFGINSVHELPAIPLRELIVRDEHDLFDGYIKEQRRKHKLSHSLVTSFQKRNGSQFRANIHVIPSVFKGDKCLQLWVHPLNAGEIDDDTAVFKSDQLNNLFLDDQVTSEVLKPKKSTPTSILKGIVKRKEATISAQPLVEMKSNEQRYNRVRTGYHMLSLKIPVAQRIGIDNLLFESGGIRLQEKRQIFWDKVKLTRLLQILIKKKKLGVNLFIRLSESSISNGNFAEWFLPGLKRVGSISSKLIFLLPVNIDEKQIRLFMKLSYKLKSYNCKVGLDDFSVSETSLTLLKHVKPDYVRLSLPWVRQIEGNNQRELALGSFIRQLESRKIKVIAPCGFSKDMRKLFALSGVSFCQERPSKTG